MMRRLILALRLRADRALRYDWGHCWRRAGEL